MSFSKRSFSVLCVAMTCSREERTLGAIPSQAVLFRLQHEGELFPAPHQGLELRHFQSRWLPCNRLMSANKIGNNGRIQQIGFVAIAGTASVMLNSPWVQ